MKTAYIRPKDFIIGKKDISSNVSSYLCRGLLALRGRYNLNKECFNKEHYYEEDVLSDREFEIGLHKVRRVY